MRKNSEYANTPKRWKCCNDLVSPKDLAHHFKEKHLKDRSGLTKKQCIGLVLGFTFFLFVLFMI